MSSYSCPSMPPTSPLYLQFPRSNSLTKLPHFSETLPTPFSSERIRTCPFKTKLSEDPEVKPIVSYSPWTKAELWATVKDFPKITKEPQRFAKKFKTVIQTYQPGFSDLYQLLYMLVSEDQTQHWMTTANWESPERSLELQLGDQPTNLVYNQPWAITRWCHWTIPRAFPKPAPWNKIQACTQKSD